MHLSPRWITDKTIAGVQPKIRALRNKEIFRSNSRSGRGIYGTGTAIHIAADGVLHVVEKDAGQYDTPADLLWATGACLFVQTAVYKEVGGLDAGFFAHQEEIDMCWRLRSRGYRLVCTPSSVVYHVGGAT